MRRNLELKKKVKMTMEERTAQAVVPLPGMRPQCGAGLGQSAGEITNKNEMPGMVGELLCPAFFATKDDDTTEF